VLSDVDFSKKNSLSLSLMNNLNDSII
jgi:hypothetical protein